MHYQLACFTHTNYNTPKTHTEWPLLVPGGKSMYNSCVNNYLYQQNPIYTHLC